MIALSSCVHEAIERLRVNKVYTKGNSNNIEEQVNRFIMLGKCNKQ